jgi:antitoxin PrlF
MSITSKLSVKAQTVLPLAVREHLHVGPGDEIEYDLREGFVLVRPVKRPPKPNDDPFRLFTEWASPADEAAYDDL